MHTTESLVALSFSALLALGSAVTGQQTQGDPSAPGSGDVYAPPQDPLDTRIDPDKVTEYDPPPLPRQVILPMPPEFRLAAAPAEVPISPDHWERARAAIQRGLTYLRSSQQTNGGWLNDVRAAPTDQPDRPSPIAVAVTALAIKAIVQAEPESLGDPNFQNAVRFVRLAQRDDGSFEGGALTSYVTSAVAMALASIDHDDFRDELQIACRWLVRNQWDQGEGLSARQDWFGGAGYGGRRRPDLSNTQTMLDALHEAGMSPDEPAVQGHLRPMRLNHNAPASIPSAMQPSNHAKCCGPSSYTSRIKSNAPTIAGPMIARLLSATRTSRPPTVLSRFA